MNKRKLPKRQRPGIKIYDDFLESTKFNWNEKQIYIILQTFEVNGQCSPTIKTLCEMSKLSKNSVLKALRGLEEKKAIDVTKKIDENGKMKNQNFYTLHDYPELWNLENEEQMIKDTDNDESILFELAKKHGYKLTKI